MLTPQKRARENFADQAHAVDERLGPGTLDPGSPERKGAQELISGHDREDCHGLDAQLSQRLEIGRRLSWKIMFSFQDHRNVLLAHLLGDPRESQLCGGPEGNGRDPWSRDGMAGVHHAVRRIDQGQRRPLDTSELYQSRQGVVDAQIEGFQRCAQELGRDAGKERLEAIPTY
jgi:hypothetical protein